MSNFIKYNFVAQGETSARVINPNANPTMVAKEREWSKLLEPEQTEEPEFSEGLNPESVAIQRESAEEIIANAKAQAEEITEQANQMAMQIRMDAEQEAKAVFEDQKAAGFTEGKLAADNYLQSEKDAMEVEFQARVDLMEQEYQEKLKTMENDIVEALGDVLEKTFHVFVKDKKEILIFLIHKTIMNLEIGKGFKIRVSAENFKFLQNELPAIREEIGSDIEIDVQNDSKLTENDCIIETEFGVYHCGIDIQLENLIMQMKALSM